MGTLGQVAYEAFRIEQRGQVPRWEDLTAMAILSWEAIGEAVGHIAGQKALERHYDSGLCGSDY